MRHASSSGYRIFVAGAALLVALAVACSSGGGSTKSALPTITPRPASTATPVAVGLRNSAEQQYLPGMSQGLQDLIRAQPWYNEMTPTKLIMLALILQAEQAARAKGEVRSVVDMMQFASEQGWYQDGLDDHEASGLGGVVLAYKTSLTKSDAPPVGASLSTTLRYQLFNTVKMPETGEKVVIVASKDVNLGRKTLEIASEYLPKVEGMVGKFPYPFMYIEVVPGLPQELAGVSYDEFIEVGTSWVQPMVISHELTHSTLYGKFPIWFEEGVAYFLGYYLTGTLESGATSAAADLRQIRADNKVDIINYGYYTTWDYVAETRRGFLFVKGLYDIVGIDGLGSMIRTLRTKSYNDQELMTAIMQQTPDNLKNQMGKYYCDRVVGLIRNYCLPGS